MFEYYGVYAVLPSIGCSIVLGPSAANAASLPTVDLGYAIYQAKLADTSGDTQTYYNFSNIRYAAPPIGQLRFAAPADPVNNRSAGVQDGSYGKICYQASIEPGSSNSSTPDPLQSEDCLFLDVIVSSDILRSSGAPVLVWIYGGAFVIGSKVINGGSAAGLLQRSREGNSKDIIYVAMNYRLGAFGFLTGTALQANGSANAGILDQRAALNWVQKYIHLFGGDPDNVTVFGESAAGSTPFQAALTQSAVFYPYTAQSDLDTTFNAYLAEAGVSSLSELRQLSSATLQKASLAIISQAPTGTFGWGPVIDNSYVPDLPGVSLSKGNYNKSVKIIAAYNANEGAVFNPNITSNDLFNNHVKNLLPLASSSVLKYVNETLYPAVYDGSQNYTNPFERGSLFISEFIIACNARYLVKAFSTANEYLFSVPPGYHGMDVSYTYFTSSNDAVSNDKLAQILQRYITNFAKTGNPNGHSAPHFPKYADGITQNLNLTFINQIKDPEANSRCDWWQQANYRQFSWQSRVTYVISLPILIENRRPPF